MNRIGTGMLPKICKVDESAEFETEERCAILEVSNDSDDPELSIARARVPAGVATAWHKLVGTAERYLIIAGEGRVEVGDLAPQTVTPGDVVRIPAETAQRIANTGGSDLIFHAICTPRFDPVNYRSLE